MWQDTGRLRDAIIHATCLPSHRSESAAMGEQTVTGGWRSGAVEARGSWRTDLQAKNALSLDTLLACASALFGERHRRYRNINVAGIELKLIECALAALS